MPRRAVGARVVGGREAGRLRVGRTRPAAQRSWIARSRDVPVAHGEASGSEAVSVVVWRRAGTREWGCSARTTSEGRWEAD